MKSILEKIHSQLISRPTIWKGPKYTIHSSVLCGWKIVLRLGKSLFEINISQLLIVCSTRENILSRLDETNRNPPIEPGFGSL